MKTITLHTGKNCAFVDSPKSKPTAFRRKISGKNGGQGRTIRFTNRPKIISGMAVVGQKEGMGVLGENFDIVQKDAKWGEKTFEKGEVRFLDASIRGAMDKVGKTENDVDLLLAGDLLNQLVTSNYVARDLSVAYMGLYNACATMTEALAVGAAFVDAGFFNTVACATCSHFATAERQYRYPLEYGCQRPPYAQWTATAAGCSLLSLNGDGPSVTHATIGKVVDYGILDMNNMGAAMATAAIDTFECVLKETDFEAEDFDMILTGDLGKLGSDIFRDLARERGTELGGRYHDCGAMMYTVNQKCYSGGSGAGCSAAILNSFLLSRLNSGKLKRILLMATGALMSPTTGFQGESIPSISHAVIIESNYREVK